MHFEEQGAFTGEIAPAMLTTTGVTYVIIGHSERRAMFNETDETCNKKLHAAYKHALKPILCVGESLEEREGGQTEALLASQLEKDLAGLSAEQVKELVIAYLHFLTYADTMSYNQHTSVKNSPFLNLKI